jgi:hypothetical protein
MPQPKGSKNKKISNPNSASKCSHSAASSNQGLQWAPPNFSVFEKEAAATVQGRRKSEKTIKAYKGHIK